MKFTRAPITGCDAVTMTISMSRVPEATVEVIHCDVQTQGTMILSQIANHLMHRIATIWVIFETVAITIVSPIVCKNMQNDDKMVSFK